MKKPLSFKSISALCLTAAMAFSLYTSTPHAFAASASAAGNASAAIITEGKTFLGTPYKYGAPAGRTDEFDCSSFIQHIFADHGISLPRSSKEQSQAGVSINRNDLKPGDLVFFYSPIHHVAVYIGNGKIMHTYGKPGVTISDLNSGWWDNHFTSARRVLPNNASAEAPAQPSVQPVKPSVTKQPAAKPVAPQTKKPDSSVSDTPTWTDPYAAQTTSFPSDYASWFQNWYW